MQREIQAVYQISQSVGRLSDLEETLELLTAEIKRLVTFDSCVIYLTDLQNQQLSPRYATGVYSDVLGRLQVKMGMGIPGWVAAHKRSLIHVSPEGDFKDSELVVGDLKSCLAVPVSIDRHVVGVICLYSASLGAYQNKHLKLMDAISHHAGLAIQNAITYQETKQDAHTDVLTALPNRRYFKSFAREELKRASEINYPVTLLMMDLDAFKQVNDQFGHRVGDHVLQEVASLLKAQMRRSDVCARFGGDEFLILLPGVDREGAEHAIERIQTAMENHVIDLESDQRISVGTSIGSATFPDQAVGLSTLVALADRAMYSNKLARERLQKSVSKLSLVDTKRPQAVEKKRSWSA